MRVKENLITRCLQASLEGLFDRASAGLADMQEMYSRLFSGVIDAGHKRAFRIPRPSKKPFSLFLEICVAGETILIGRQELFRFLAGHPLLLNGTFGFLGLGRAREIHRRYYPLMDVNFCETSPGPVKVAMEMMGLMEANFRLPMVRPSELNCNKVANVLKSLDLLQADAAA